MKYRAVVRMHMTVWSEKEAWENICQFTDATLDLLRMNLVVDFEYAQWWMRYVRLYASYTGVDSTDSEFIYVAYAAGAEAAAEEFCTTSGDYAYINEFSYDATFTTDQVYA